MSADSSNCLKGIMAIAVVLHHLAQRTDIFAFSAAFRDFGSVAVGCFFFISGYGLLSSYKKKGKSYLDGFALKRFRKLVIPFVFVILLYQSSRMFAAIDFGDILRTGRVGSILPFSWYIFCAIFLYFVFYLSFRFAGSYFKGILACWLFTAMLVLFLRIIHWPGYWYASLPLFPLGLTYKQIEEKLVGSGCRKVMGLLLFICMFVGIVKLFHVQHTGMLQNVLAPFVFILPVTVFNLSVPWLKKLSVISYEIYLVQGIFIMGLRSDVIYIQNDGLYVLLCCVLVFPFAYIVKRFLNILDKALAKVFGW